MVFEIVFRCVVFYCSSGFVEISSALQKEHSNPEPVETGFDLRWVVVLLRGWGI